MNSFERMSIQTANARFGRLHVIEREVIDRAKRGERMLWVVADEQHAVAARKRILEHTGGAWPLGLRIHIADGKPTQPLPDLVIWEEES